MKDKRIKMCPNSECSRHNKYKYSAEDIYCSECREELVFVCAKCGKRINDEGPQHRFCRSCNAKAADRKDKIKDALVAIPAVGVNVVAFANELKKAAPVAIKAASKIAKKL